MDHQEIIETLRLCAKPGPCSKDCELFDRSVYECGNLLSDAADLLERQMRELEALKKKNSGGK